MQNRSPRQSTKGVGRRRRPLVAVIVVILSACYVILAFFILKKSTSHETVAIQQQAVLLRNTYYSDHFPPFRESTEKCTTKNLANDIVVKAFNETYAFLLPNYCIYQDDFKTCLKNTYDMYNTNNSSPLYPWWFRTLLRDVLDDSSGAHGAWHVLLANTTNPPLSFCRLEKVATKQWRKVFCALDMESNNHSAACWRGYGRIPPVVPSQQGVADQRERVVFLRDPLERFLSAFLDKCELYPSRTHEGHCEPNAVFQDEALTKGLLLSEPTIHPGKRSFNRHQQKLLFDAYVDTMPLKWNIHFMPMGLLCNGLYREIQSYDLVGNMGPDFYQQLQQVGERYDIMPVLRKVFKLEKYMVDNSTNNHGVETSAALRVQDYYTPKTLRRVLEYASLDYVMLNLTIPEWANQMLLEAS